MYRTPEAHFCMYLALTKLYMKKFIDDHLEIEKDSREATIDALSNVHEYSKENKDIIRYNHQDVLDIIKSINFSILQGDFDKSLDNPGKHPESLKTSGQEEADTGIVLHAIDVCRRDPFSELTISCSDTDVLLILLNYFEQLPSTAIFKTTEHCYNLRQIFERFTPRVCKALLGFHEITGRD